MPDATVARLVRQAVEQGFAEKVADPVVLGRVASILRNASRHSNGARMGPVTDLFPTSAGCHSDEEATSREGGRRGAG
jgi:hypothetical protein